MDLRSQNSALGTCDSAQAHSDREAALVLEAEETAAAVPDSVRCSAALEESSRSLSVVLRLTPACSTVRAGLLERCRSVEAMRGELTTIAPSSSRLLWLQSCAFGRTVDGGHRAVKYTRLHGVTEEVYNEGTHIAVRSLPQLQDRQIS